MSSVLCIQWPNKTAKAQIIIIMQIYGGALSSYDTNRQVAKWASARAGEGVSFFLLREMSTTKCVSFKYSLDCQQMKIYCVSTTRWLFLGQDTQISSPVKCTAPTARILPSFLHRKLQGLILISLAVRNNILGGLEIVVIDYCRENDQVLFFNLCIAVAHTNCIRDSVSLYWYDSAKITLEQKRPRLCEKKKKEKKSLLSTFQNNKKKVDCVIVCKSGQSSRCKAMRWQGLPLIIRCAEIS